MASAEGHAARVGERDGRNACGRLDGGQGGPRDEVGDVGKETKPLTSFMFRTGGSMKREPRLETMKDVTQNATRSWRRERTISIRCISLQALSHSPGEEGRCCRESLGEEGI